MDFNKIPDKIPEMEVDTLKQSRYSVYNYDAYTLQELICVFYQHMNECVHASNFALEFTKWLMDTGVEHEVKKKIEEMEKDGTLAHIINEVLFEDLNAKIDEKTKLITIDKTPTILKTNEYYMIETENKNLETGKSVKLMNGEGTYHYPITSADNVVKNNVSIDSDIEKLRGYDNEIVTRRLRGQNSVDSPAGTFDSANFAGQGKTSNIPIGNVFHHYTDGKVIQVDNVGENNVIMTLVNANNKTRRPDKPDNFYGKGYYMQLMTNNPNTSEVYSHFVIDEKGNFFWNGITPTGTKTNTTSFKNAKEDNSTPAFQFEAINKHIRPYSFYNGGNALLLLEENLNKCDIISPSNLTGGLQLESKGGDIRLVSKQGSNVDVVGKLRRSYGNLSWKEMQPIMKIDKEGIPNEFLSGGFMIFDPNDNEPLWRNKDNTDWVEYDGVKRVKEKILVEKGGHIHTGGFKYSAFCSGARLRDKEYYVVRCGINHVSNSFNKSVIVMYRKINDKFYGKILDLKGHVGDFRDPHLSVNSGGNRLILTCACKDDNSDIHRSYMWTIEENGQISNATLISENLFVWGNCVNHPDTGQVVTTGYDSNNLYVLTSAGRETQPGTWTKTIIATSGESFRPTEACLGYWGQKLVCIYRNDHGTTRMRTTNAYTGTSGWETEKILNNVGRGEAPKIPQYTPAKKPLLLLTSLRKSDNTRTVSAQMMVNFEGSCTSQYDIASISDGGYCSMVITENGIGCMYYEETKRYEETNLWYKKLDKLNDFGNYMYWDFELGRK